MKQRRQQGSSQLQSIMLIGTVALGGAGAFSSLGTSVEQSISGKASSAPSAAIARPAVGGASQAGVLSSLSDITRLGTKGALRKANKALRRVIRAEVPSLWMENVDKIVKLTEDSTELYAHRVARVQQLEDDWLPGLQRHATKQVVASAAQGFELGPEHFRGELAGRALDVISDQDLERFRLLSHKVRSVLSDDRYQRINATRNAWLPVKLRLGEVAPSLKYRDLQALRKLLFDPSMDYAERIVAQLDLDQKLIPGIGEKTMLRIVEAVERGGTLRRQAFNRHYQGIFGADISATDLERFNRLVEQARNVIKQANKAVDIESAALPPVLRASIKKTVPRLTESQVQRVFDLVDEPVREYANRITKRVSVVSGSVASVRRQAVEAVVRAAERGYDLRDSHFAGPFDGYHIDVYRDDYASLQALVPQVRQIIQAPQ